MTVGHAIDARAAQPTSTRCHEPAADDVDRRFPAAVLRPARRGHADLPGARASAPAILFFVSGQPLVGVAQLVIDELNSPTLMALPLFVMAAAFMRLGGVAKALVDLSRRLARRHPGSLGLVTVVACTLFAAICGSRVATALAMGTILLPAMIETRLSALVRARRGRRLRHHRHRDPAAAWR